MPITYTNRKCYTYYLCQGIRKSGKVFYYFAREPKENSPDKIPEGYRISESVNGIVSLVKERPMLIAPQEVACVEAALAKHPRSREYRVTVKEKQIIIYEQLGPNFDAIFTMFGKRNPLSSEISRKNLQDQLDKIARFSPILRFTLADPLERKFITERWCYLGNIDDWIDIGESGQLENFALSLIPLLGTDDFYEL